MLTALKLWVAWLSNSVGVLSEGIHSFLDVISAGVSYFTVREAVKPADEGHPFGHGKIETVSSLFESLLLIAAAGLIIYEGVIHLKHPEPIQHGLLAIGVIVFSIVVSYLVYRHNRSAAVLTESTALHVNALHFLSDVVASLGILVGLIILKLTGWTLIDPIIAFCVAAYILLVSLKQVREALIELTDTKLPQAEVDAIRDLVSSVLKGRVIEAHDLRTRKSGAVRHIDFHLVVCGHMSVENSHAVCDLLESKITTLFPKSFINIHVEPCEKESTECHLTCTIYQQRK